jgi:hypothetical protein
MGEMPVNYDLSGKKARERLSPRSKFDDAAQGLLLAISLNRASSLILLSRHRVYR